MIREFALEPDLVVDWAVNDIGRHVRQFGLDQRRLVSDFPEGWEGCVFGALYERFGYDDSGLAFQNCQVLLQGFVQYLSEYMVYRGIKIPADANWLSEAIKEHKRAPFSGIVARSIPTGALAEGLEPEHLDQFNNPYWTVPALSTTPKTAKAIARAVHGLLSCSKEIVLIDPYFDADKVRFRDTIAEILQIVFHNQRPCPFPKVVHLHTSIERVFRRDEKRTEVTEQKAAAYILQKCQEKLPALLPRGCTLQVTVLKEKAGSGRLHNRFVLTDVGGAILPHGTDEEDDPERKTDDDILPLHTPMLRSRWREYVTKLQYDVVAEMTLTP